MPDKMSNLQNEQGNEIKGEADISEAVVKFYKELYETQDIIENDANFFNEIRAIPGENSAEVIKDITKDELLETLKTCKDSAPGPMASTTPTCVNSGIFLAPCW